MWRPFSVFSRIHQSPQCRCSDFPQAGMKPDPCRGGRGLEERGSRGRGAGDTQDGDAGTRRTETRGHAGWRHADRRRGSTQDGDAGTRRTETRGRGNANGPAVGQNRGKVRKSPTLPGFVPGFRPLRTLQTEGPVAETTGPRFNLPRGYSSAATGSSVAAADSHDVQSVHSPAGSAHAAGSTAAGSETAADSPADSGVTAWNSASSVRSS